MTCLTAEAAATLGMFAMLAAGLFVIGVLAWDDARRADRGGRQ